MFPPIVRGLERAGFAPDEIRYFTLHVLQDQDHGAWLEEGGEVVSFVHDGCSVSAIRLVCWGDHDPCRSRGYSYRQLTDEF